MIENGNFQSVFGLNADEFFNSFNKGGSESISTLTQFCDGFYEMDDTMRSYLTDCMQKQVPASFDGYNKYVQSAINSNKQLTASAKAVKIGMQALATVSNMFIGMAISWGISKIFEGIDNLIHAEEKIIEKAKEAQQAIDDVQNSLKNVTSTVEENRDRFIELSEGVDKFSKNLTLSEEEYKEYLSISQQLAEIFPELVISYDEQGNALLNIGDNAEETNAKLNELLETEKQLAKQTLIDNMDDVAKGVAVEAKDLLDDVKKTKNEIETLERQQKEDNFDLLNSSTFTAKQDSHAFVEMKRALEKAGVKYNELEPDVHYNMLDTNVTLDYSSASKEQLEAAQEYYDNYMSLINKQHAAELSGLKRDLAQKEALYNNHYSKMTANLQAWISEDYNYQYLSDSSQKIIDALIPNIDWTKVKPKNSLDYQDYITKSILEPLLLVPEEHKAEIDAMFSKLLSFEQGDINVVDFAFQIQEKLKEFDIIIDLTPIISEEQELKNRLNNSINNIVSGTRDKNGQLVLTDKDLKDRKKLEEYTSKLSKDQLDLWLESTKGIKEAEKAIKSFEKALENLPKETPIILGISETINELNTKLKPTMDSLSSAWKNVFDDNGNFVQDNVNLDMFTSIKSQLDSLNKDFGISIDGYEELIKTLSNTETGTTEAKDAFNDFATSLFYGVTASGMFNNETKDTIVQMMESLGITNALEIANEQLAITEESVAFAEQSKADALMLLNSGNQEVISTTQAKIQAYLTEAGASDVARLATFRLIAAEEIFGKYDLNCSEKIQELNKLASAYLTTAQSARLAAYTKGLEKSGLSSEEVVSKSQAYIDQMTTETVKIDVDYDGMVGDAGKAGGNSGDAYVEEFEKALDKLKTLRDQGKISEKQYLEEYRKLYERYFKDIEKYAEEFAKHQYEYLSGMKSLYESVFSAVTSIIDEQIEAYQDQKEAAEEYYDSQIEKIDEQIEKINKSREAREDEMAVQKALYDLIRANNQRTVKTLDEYGNTVYKANQSSVRENQDNYQNTKDDYEIKRLEKKREQYEKLKEQSNEYYDNLIKGLEEYKERWEELLEMEERAKMLALLEEFGYTEQDILNMSEEAFADLKTQYLQVLKDMYNGNDNVLKHLSDISGVDMSSLEGHLQATADLTGDVADGFEDITKKIKDATDALGDFNEEAKDDGKDFEIKTYGEILNEFIIKSREAAEEMNAIEEEMKAIEERIKSMAETYKEIYGSGKNPYQGNPSIDTNQNSSKKDSNSSTPATTLTSSKSIVTTDGAILTPVNNLSLKTQSLDIGNIIPNNSLSQISSNIASQIAKAIKVDTTKTVQLTQQVTINAPYLTNDSGYNRLMDEFKGLSSAAYINSINNKN